MEKSAQSVSEEDSGVCCEPRAGEGDNDVMDRATGHDPLPGSGRHNEAGENGGEGSCNACPPSEEKEERQKDASPDEAEGLARDTAELTVDAYIDRMDLSSLTPRQRARFELEVEEQQHLTDEAREAMANVPFGKRATADEIMAHHTSFRVGGAVEAFIVARDVQDVRDVMNFATEKNVPVTFIGNGTKTLVRDGGLRGIVLQLGDAFDAIEVQREEGDETWISVSAATSVGDLYSWAASKNFVVDKSYSCTRGTVAGAFMIDPAPFAACIKELTIVDKSGREVTLTRKAITDGERIRFGRSAVITKMILCLKKAEDVQGDEGRGSSSVNERARLDDVFKNNGKQTAKSIIADAGMNGIRVGRVRIDDQDANCFINEGNAKTRDAIILIGLIKDRVRQSQGIQLDTAVRIVGEE